MVYGEEKNDEATEGNDFYTVGDGDTLHSIAMRYGIKTESLEKLNNIDKDDTLLPGTRLRLRR